MPDDGINMNKTLTTTEFNRLWVNALDNSRNYSHTVTSNDMDLESFLLSNHRKYRENNTYYLKVSIIDEYYKTKNCVYVLKEGEKEAKTLKTVPCDESWQDEFPTEEGVYWFFGWIDYKYAMKTNQKPDVYVCKARKVSNGVLHVIEGQFIWKSEAKGKFQKVIDHSSLPEIEI